MSWTAYMIHPSICGIHGTRYSVRLHHQLDDYIYSEGPHHRHSALSVVPLALSFVETSSPLLPSLPLDITKVAGGKYTSYLSASLFRRYQQGPGLTILSRLIPSPIPIPPSTYIHRYTPPP